jgi:hypothetical protein
VALLAPLTAVAAPRVASAGSDPSGVAAARPLTAIRTTSAGAAVANPAGEFVPVSPERILDTRIAVGGHPGKLAGGSALDLQVVDTPAHSVPATGVLAVAVNVTATDTTADGYLTAWPTGAARPVASNLNFRAGQSVANLAVVGVGANGRISIFSLAGTVDVVVDVVGWYASDTSAMAAGQGSRLYPVAPQRILDTRSGLGWAGGADPANGVIELSVQGVFHDRNGAVVSDASGLVLNLTGVGATAPTYLTAYPGGADGRPDASSLNLTGGQTRPNLVMVKVAADGKIRIYNHSGSVHVLVDVVGFYRPGADPATFAGRVVPLTTPYRVLDTRDDGVRLGTQQEDGWDFQPFVDSLQGGSSPAGPVEGVIMNLTATAVTASSYLTAYPADVTRPVASNLNVEAGDSVPNLTVLPLSAGAVKNHINVFFYQGFAHYLGDVSAIILSD